MRITPWQVFKLTSVSVCTVLAYISGGMALYFLLMRGNIEHSIALGLLGLCFAGLVFFLVSDIEESEYYGEED